MVYTQYILPHPLNDESGKIKEFFDWWIEGDAQYTAILRDYKIYLKNRLRRSLIEKAFPTLRDIVFHTDQENSSRKYDRVYKDSILVHAFLHSSDKTLKLFRKIERALGGKGKTGDFISDFIAAMFDLLKLEKEFKAYLIEQMYSPNPEFKFPAIPLFDSKENTEPIEPIKLDGTTPFEEILDNGSIFCSKEKLTPEELLKLNNLLKRIAERFHRRHGNKPVKDDKSKPPKIIMLDSEEEFVLRARNDGYGAVWNQFANLNFSCKEGNPADENNRPTIYFLRVSGERKFKHLEHVYWYILDAKYVRLGAPYEKITYEDSSWWLEGSPAYNTANSELKRYLKDELKSIPRDKLPTLRNIVFPLKFESLFHQDIRSRCYSVWIAAFLDSSEKTRKVCKQIENALRGEGKRGDVLVDYYIAMVHLFKYQEEFNAYLIKQWNSDNPEFDFSVTTPFSSEKNTEPTGPIELNGTTPVEKILNDGSIILSQKEFTAEEVSEVNNILEETTKHFCHDFNGPVKGYNSRPLKIIVLHSKEELVLRACNDGYKFLNEFDKNGFYINNLTDQQPTIYICLEFGKIPSILNYLIWIYSEKKYIGNVYKYIHEDNSRWWIDGSAKYNTARREDRIALKKWLKNIPENELPDLGEIFYGFNNESISQKENKFYKYAVLLHAFLHSTDEGEKISRDMESALRGEGKTGNVANDFFGKVDELYEVEEQFTDYLIKQRNSDSSEIEFRTQFGTEKNDVYTFSSGSRDYFIKDSGGDNDVINFTSESISKENILFKREGDDLKLFIGIPNFSCIISIKDQYKPKNQIETIRAGLYEIQGDSINQLTEVMMDPIFLAEGESSISSKTEIETAINKCWRLSHS